MSTITVQQLQADEHLIEINRLLDDIRQTAVNWYLELINLPTDQATVDSLAGLRQSLMEIAGPVD